MKIINGIEFRVAANDREKNNNTRKEQTSAKERGEVYTNPGDNKHIPDPPANQLARSKPNPIAWLGFTSLGSKDHDVHKQTDGHDMIMTPPGSVGPPPHMCHGTRQIYQSNIL